MSPKAMGLYKDVVVHLVFGFLFLFVGPFFAGGFAGKKAAVNRLSFRLKACEVEEGNELGPDVGNDTKTTFCASKKAAPNQLSFCLKPHPTLMLVLDGFMKNLHMREVIWVWLLLFYGYYV